MGTIRHAAALTAAVIIPLVVAPAAVSAAEEDRKPLTVNGRRLGEALRPVVPGPALAFGSSEPRLSQRATAQQQAGSSDRSWIRRHPVAFGMLVGAVAGASIVGATVHAEASPLGFFGGGAAGAIVGWAVSQ